MGPVIGDRVQDAHGAACIGDRLWVKDNVGTDDLAVLIYPLLFFLDISLVLFRDWEQKNQGMGWLRNHGNEFLVQT